MSRSDSLEQPTQHYRALPIDRRRATLYGTLSINTRRAKRPKTLSLDTRRARATFSSEIDIFDFLWTPRSLATDFAQTSRSQNMKLHNFNSGRYEFHQNRPSEIKVMNDFPKFSTKYVGPSLEHVCPRCTYSIALRVRKSPFLQAICTSVAL